MPDAVLLRAQGGTLDLAGDKIRWERAIDLAIQGEAPKRVTYKQALMYLNLEVDRPKGPVRRF